MITEKRNYFKISNDAMFKLIFTNDDNRDLLEKLIEEVINEKVEVINFIPTEQNKSKIKTKGKILDLLVKTNHGEVNIEVNTYINDYIHRRNSGYIFKRYSEAINVSESYQKMGNYIQINLTNGGNNMPFYSLYKLCDFNSKKEFINNLSIYEINLNKTENLCYSGSGYELLSMFNMGYQELMDIKGDKYMEKLRDENVRLNKDDEIYEFLSAETEERLWNNSLKQEGFDDGYDKGIDEGRIQERENLVREMLKDGLDINKIALYTGLSIDEINDIKDQD